MYPQVHMCACLCVQPSLMAEVLLLLSCTMHAASYMCTLLWLGVFAGQMLRLCLQWHTSSLTLQPSPQRMTAC